MTLANIVRDFEKHYTGWVQFLFSEAICEYLENNNISRKQFAKDLKLPVKDINRILDDVEKTTLDDMTKIVAYLENKNIHISIKFEEFKK